MIHRRVKKRGRMANVDRNHVPILLTCNRLFLIGDPTTMDRGRGMSGGDTARSLDIILPLIGKKCW
jgi:hypothetical protein